MKRKRPPTIKNRIDRVIPGLGRRLIRTGARTLIEHRARVVLFDYLVENGQIDTIRMLLSKRTSWAELRQAQMKGQLRSETLAADVALSRNLWNAIDATVKTMGRTASARARYKLSFAQLKKYAIHWLPAKTTVEQLRHVSWQEIFSEMHDLSPATRNRLRAAVSAFLTTFLGDKFHPFRRAVVRSIGKMERENTLPKEITVDEFWKNLEATDERCRASIITLAGTGLRVGEFLACDETSAHRLPVIWFPGGKTGADETVISDQLLPFAQQSIPCTIAPRPTVDRGIQYDARYKRIYNAMRAASETTGIAWSPHYLRHLYAKLGTDKLSQALVQQGLRHSSPAMTAMYAKRKTVKQVATVVGRALLKGQPKAAKTSTRNVRAKVSS